MKKLALYAVSAVVALGAVGCSMLAQKDQSVPVKAVADNSKMTRGLAAQSEADATWSEHFCMIQTRATAIKDTKVIGSVETLKIVPFANLLTFVDAAGKDENSFIKKTGRADLVTKALQQNPIKGSDSKAGVIISPTGPGRIEVTFSKDRVFTSEQENNYLHVGQVYEIKDQRGQTEHTLQNSLDVKCQ